MIYSVSTLNNCAKEIIESNFFNIEVEGEISSFNANLKSSHWYFVIKDENSAINCVMFKNSNLSVKFTPEVGLKIKLIGKLSIYTPTGSFQFIANSMSVVGEGDLEFAFNQLKEKLAKKGYFNNKSPIPKFPKRVGLITSITSAAYADIIKTANSRFCACEFFVIDSMMQGDDKSVIKSLKKLDSMGLDVIVIARGGGSKEDLWLFNSEALADEIFLAKTPIISAIGHQSDFSISDFVADFRAITPTDSMVVLLPDKAQFAQMLDKLQDDLDDKMCDFINHLSNLLQNLLMKLKSFGVLKNINLKDEILNNFIVRLNSKISQKIQQNINILDIYETKISKSYEFLQSLKDFVKIKKDGRYINLKKLKNGDEITLISIDCKKDAIIKD